MKQPKAIQPTQAQIANCLSTGWEYDNEWFFAKGDLIGYFTAEGFKKEKM